MNFTITLPSVFDCVELESSESGCLRLMTEAKNKVGTLLVINFEQSKGVLTPTYIEFVNDVEKMVSMDSIEFLREPIETLLNAHYNKIMSVVRDYEAEEDEKSEKFESMEDLI